MIYLRIIGVTGGIGSGKSTVTRILADMGAAVIDADVIARDIVRKGQKAFKELVSFFGDEVVAPDGELDRKALGAIVFNHKDKLESLNDITHKYVVERIGERLLELKRDKAVSIIVVDVPIPVRHGFIDVVDEVWTVVSDREKRIVRVMKRSGLTYDQVLERINSQKSDEEYMEIAHKVIVNDGSEEELRKQVLNLILR